MDEVVDRLQNIEDNIEKMQNFIALSLRRDVIGDDVRKIIEQVNKTKKKMAIAKELLDKELEGALAEQSTVMVMLRQKQAVLLDRILAERRRKIREAEEEETQIQSALVKHAPVSACKLLLPGLAKMKIDHQHAITPKMTIYDYKESPLVKQKLNPVPFTFLEFEFIITPQQFDTIPKYMRGRETIEELNHFLETIIIPCFNEKYQLLHRQRQAVRHPSDLELWKMYNSQVSYLPGRNFITPGDISRKINKMIDKKLQNRIVMLRHIGVLQEQRVSHTVCYIWKASS